MPGQIWIPAADNNVNEALAGGCPLSLLLAFHQSTSTAAAWRTKKGGIQQQEWDMGYGT